EAKKLVLEQGQYVIGAGVETGHHNEGRYITASGGHYDSYMTLRYRGKGESADDIATFSGDQIWIKRDVEGQQDVFTLQNLSTGLWLCIGQPIGNVGYIIAAYEEPSTTERSYWIVKNDMLYAVDQEGIVDQAVDFTKTTDNVPDTQKQPRTDNYFHTRGASSMKFESKPLFYRLSNMDNTNLDNQKSETKTRLINILRRVSGSPLGNLSDLYNDILENDSSLNYSESDYAALENALKLSVATLQSTLYRIQIGKNAAWADEDGFVRFSLIDNTNLKQLWSRDTVAGSTDKELFYSFCNAVYGSYLYQSDEQNPAFQGISDFGCYVKHAKESLLGDDNDRILFSYSDEGNLLPKVNNSALAAQVSLRFKETGGDHKVFTDAGQSSEKEVRIEQIDDVETTMYIAAQCYQTLSDLRKNRIDDPETFSNEDLSALQVQAEALLKNSALYSAGSVENLQNAVAEIQSILTAQENGEHVKISTKNLAGSVLKAAMSALQDLTNTATSSYKQRLLNAMNTLKKTMEATDDVGAKLYCEPCINAAQKQLTSADQVLADITATYQTVDKAVAALEDRNQKMVLNKNYLTLFQNLEGVRYRDVSIYQPETWEPLYAYFQEAENVYKSIQKYTNSEIVKCNTEFSGYVRALQKRATISSLEALLSMLKNLNLKQSDFTVQTWAPYIRTYNEAVALVKNADAQQGSVDTIINALVTAANALAYQDNDGSVGMFPAILTGSQKNLRDRYDEGYQLGIRWGSYEGYEKAWREGYDKTMAALKNELSPQEDDEPEAPVQEITQTVTTVTERFYQPGGLPAWLIYVLIGSGVFLFIAFGLIGFAVAKKRSNKKPPISKTIGEEELP
ncbi:MAG: hypothetical protein IJT66_00115, partial [Clostridia bacterium]|nr:hypothetical protein [Clostridia bacterium]